MRLLPTKDGRSDCYPIEWKVSVKQGRTDFNSGIVCVTDFWFQWVLCASNTNIKTACHLDVWKASLILCMLNEGDEAHCVARLTRNRSVVRSNPVKASRCFLEQETLSSLFSTGWFQERIWGWFHNRTKIHRVPYNIDWHLCQISSLIEYHQIQNQSKTSTRLLSIICKTTYLIKSIWIQETIGIITHCVYILYHILDT